MSRPQRQNQHFGTGGYGGNHRPGLLPSDMIRPLLDNTPSWRHKSILGNAIYYRVKALERQHRRKITAMLLDQSSSRDQLLHILDNGPVFRIRVEEAREVYEAYHRRCRDENALMEEAPSTPLRNQDSPNQARTQTQPQYQSQPMVRTQTHRNPRQSARSPAHGEAQTTTVVNGVTIRPAFSQTQLRPLPLPRTQPRPQLQRRQNVVDNAHNGAPRPAANGGRRVLLEFEYQNGWLICRNPETRAYFVLHEWTVVAMYAIIIFLNTERWQPLRTLLLILIVFCLQHIAEQHRMAERRD
ncbi:hypothetical protein LA080_003645 [Diaporthe eres]|nr:hypothetical protein LA080_003645 [Diaporthe eres]